MRTQSLLSFNNVTLNLCKLRLSGRSGHVAQQRWQAALERRRRVCIPLRAVTQGIMHQGAQVAAVAGALGILQPLVQPLRLAQQAQQPGQGGREVGWSGN